MFVWLDCSSFNLTIYNMGIGYGKFMINNIKTGNMFVLTANFLVASWMENKRTRSLDCLSQYIVCELSIIFKHLNELLFINVLINLNDTVTAFVARSPLAAAHKHSLTITRNLLRLLTKSAK
jgi:hypothetical protein